MRRTMSLLAIAVAICGMGRVASAGLIEWTTGDLGNNVIIDGGDFNVFPLLILPDNGQPAELEVKYGLWNSPEVPVDVYLNEIFIGSFVADQGYITPGPEFITFDVTGLLLDGENTVLFTGSGFGDYVIGQVWVRYYDIPAPATMGLFALALCGYKRRRR